MKLTVFPGSPLHGELGSDLPGDKSISHRAALFAALADGESRIENFQISGVTRPMLQALTALQVPWNLDGNTLTIQGSGLSGIKSPAAPIDCGNSATTLRLLAGVLAAAGIEAELSGSAGLSRRPMDRILEPLRAMGAHIDAAAGGTAPLHLHARAAGTFLTPLNYSLPVASAQVKSCLLLAALNTQGKTVLSEPGPSRDHTERMLSAMGVDITFHQENGAGGPRYLVEMVPPSPLCLSPLHMKIPGDPSAAAFLIAAALTCPGSALKIQGICLNPTRTGLLDALLSMGARIEITNRHLLAGEPTGDVSVEYRPLHGCEINGALVVRMIDEFPALAAAASFALGTTIVHDAAELRLKESDRISVLAAELRKMGITVEEFADGFAIHGGSVAGGSVQAHGDHRLAMTLIVTALSAAAPTTIDGAECMAESFPGFAETLQKLGARIEVES
jgi:3-phosphoshikimate 1-carboxyvinyltransferase